MSDNSSWNFSKRKRGGKREKGTSRAKEEAATPLIATDDYERERSKILEKLVLSENLFIHLRTQLRDNKLKELQDYKAAVATKTCPEYIAGKRESDEVLAKQNDLIQARFEMKMAQIQDEYEAEVDMANRSYEDRYNYAKCRYIEYVKNLIAEKERRAKDIGNILGALLCLPPLPHPFTEKPVFKEDVDRGRITRSQSKSRRSED
uniref:DUF2040 domain-containing protein n=1 Tax=Caenorhabditis tropicalis TaxID=1561998 RepID=A0A1I7U9B9_9PELO